MPKKKTRATAPAITKKHTRVTTPQKANMPVSSEEKLSRFNFLKESKVTILSIIILAFSAYVLLASQGIFNIATVNGEVISRKEYKQELEKQGGQQVLNSIIVKKLVLQEARKRNITVSDAEAEAGVKKIEKNVSSQGQSLSQLLAAQGMTREGFLEQVKLQKLVEKMVSKDTTVTDQEVEKFIKGNPGSFTSSETQSEVAPDRSKIKEQLKAQKLSEKIQELVGDLQKKAKTTRF